MVAVVLADELVIPRVDTYADFRAWTLSADFPRSGRIDFIDGQIEVDMAPERIYTHSLILTEVSFGIVAVVKSGDLGHVLSDRTRVCVPGRLSCEPDLSFVSWESLESGRVKYASAKKTPHDPFDFVEVRGGPDLVVEIVSPESVGKDTKRLPLAYFAAGVREFWLIDARGPKLSFIIHERGRTRWKAVKESGDNFSRSAVLDHEFRLVRRAGRAPETFAYRLEGRG